MRASVFFPSMLCNRIKLNSASEFLKLVRSQVYYRDSSTINLSRPLEC
uniref:Uncharacterized protein n=1 Tax=Arundo donax TaxID=35708 RepID=A0A0A9B3N6_ARUDO